VAGLRTIRRTSVRVKIAIRSRVGGGYQVYLPSRLRLSAVKGRHLASIGVCRAATDKQQAAALARPRLEGHAEALHEPLERRLLALLRARHHRLPSRASLRGISRRHGFGVFGLLEPSFLVVESMTSGQRRLRAHPLRSEARKVRISLNSISQDPHHWRRSLRAWVSTVARRRLGAERSTFRWLPSTPLDWPMVTGEGHMVALENGGG